MADYIHEQHSNEALQNMPGKFHDGMSCFWDMDRPDRQYYFDELPKFSDIAIVGAGYTGLSTALHLALAGRKVTILEAGLPGNGCSSRNGGMIGPSFHKLGLKGLTSKYGDHKAHAILKEGMEAIDFTRNFLSAQKIDCNLHMTGRFRGAFSLRDYDALARNAEALKKAVGFSAEAVPQAEQHKEIGSDIYHGGVVYHQDGGLHPGKLVDGLVQRCREAGVLIVPSTRVLGWDRTSGSLTVQTTSGSIGCKELVIATNGYSGPDLPWFQNRIIPIPSVMVATEEMSPEKIRSFSPKGRMHGDTRRVVLYYRPSHDGKRMLFGSRATAPLDQPALLKSGFEKMYAELFPGLKNVRASHVWYGLVAYSFDHAPHIGTRDGVHYAMGYCGSGITRALYLGMKLSRKITGQKDSATSFDDLPFETRPLYRGKPHGLEWIMRWHAFVDWMNRKRG